MYKKFLYDWTSPLALVLFYVLNVLGTRISDLDLPGVVSLRYRASSDSDHPRSAFGRRRRRFRWTRRGVSRVLK